MLINVILIIILLSFSFIFSGTETAFFSLTDIEINNLINMKRKKVLAELNSNRTSFLITLLFMNTFVNIFFVSVFNRIFLSFGYEISGLYLIEIIIITFILLIIGEITPKILAIYKTEIFINMIYITYVFYFLLYPVHKTINFFLNLLSNNKNNTKFESDEFKEMLDLLKKAEMSIVGEINLLEHYIKLKEFKAIDIAKKKNEIIYINKNANTMEVFDIFEQNRFSRIPVVNENIDNIVGIIYFKDMMLIDEKASVKSIMRNIQVFDYNIKVMTLLGKFLRNKRHMAILIDKEGKTKGLITLNDIIEKLLGPLPDEKGETL